MCAVWKRAIPASGDSTCKCPEAVWSEYREKAGEWCRVGVKLFTGSRLCEVRWLGHVSPFPGLFSLT